MKKKMIIGILIIIIITSMFISLDKFWTINFISGSVGFIRVVYFNEPYVKVSDNPTVYLVNTNTDMIKIFEGLGYIYDKENRAGSLYPFEKDVYKYIMSARHNGIFSKWQINE